MTPTCTAGFKNSGSVAYQTRLGNIIHAVELKVRLVQLGRGLLKALGG
jgi:hypothetical protein